MEATVYTCEMFGMAGMDGGMGVGMMLGMLAWGLLGLALAALAVAAAVWLLRDSWRRSAARPPTTDTQ